MQLNLNIQRQAPISIHQQLVTQFSLQIASGLLAEGTKLPSVRGLSNRLGIHYNTCLSVYKELAEMGMVESRRGSGVVVSSFQAQLEKDPMQGQALHQMATYFVDTVSEKGYSWAEVEIALRLARQKRQKNQKRLAFVDVYPDILPVFKAELEQALKQPVETIFLPEFNPQNADPGLQYVVSRYHYKAFQDVMPTDATVLVIDISTSPTETNLIKTLPEGALVVILSYSSIILQTAESVISSLRGEELLVKTLMVREDVDEILSIKEHANLIICDALCLQDFPELPSKKTRAIQLIAEEELERIRQYSK